MHFAYSYFYVCLSLRTNSVFPNSGFVLLLSKFVCKFPGHENLHLLNTFTYLNIFPTFMYHFPLFTALLLCR